MLQNPQLKEGNKLIGSTKQENKKNKLERKMKNNNNLGYGYRTKKNALCIKTYINSEELVQLKQNKSSRVKLSK